MPSSSSPRKIGIVGVVVRAGRLLVIQRSQTVSAPGKFCFPGGTMEPGETEPQTLVREFQEELGVDVTPRALLHRSITPWRVDLRWWQGDLADNALLIPNPEEVAAALWLSVPEILAIPELLDSNRLFLHAWHQAEFAIHGLSVPS